MLASTNPSSTGFRVKSSASRTRLVPSMSPDMTAPSELERRLRLGRLRGRGGRSCDVFELRPFLRQFVIDERLVVEALARRDLKQAVGELLRVRRTRAHLRDELGC